MRLSWALVVDMGYALRLGIYPDSGNITHCISYPATIRHIRATSLIEAHSLHAVSYRGHPTPKNPGSHPRAQSTPQASKISKGNSPKHLKFQDAILSHMPQSFLTALVSPTMRSITMIREITPKTPQTHYRALQKPCRRFLHFRQNRHMVGQDRQGLPDKERQLSMNTNA